MSSNGSNKNKKGKMIEWRRNKVQQLLVQGYSQWEVADELKIDQSTVSRDTQYLKQQAQENLKSHIQDRLPEEYQRCLTGINQVLKLSWQIANATNMNGLEDSNVNGNKTITITEKDKIRLQAAALANDCYKYIMDLTTNGVVITDAIKYVQTSKEKLTMSTKEEDIDNKESDKPDYNEDKEIEEKEQQKTNNDVF